MRLATSGSIPRLDISLPVAALVPLREEWAALRFGADGRAINPVSGEPTDAIRLVEGRHRSPGARYETVIRTPRMSADPDQVRALEAELLDRPDIDWTEYHRRRAELSTPTGEVDESISGFTVRSDDARALAVTFADPKDRWSVDVDVEHGRIPRVLLTARADATSLIQDEGAPRWLARRVGGTATGTATIDLSTIERRGGGTLAEGSGRVKLLRGEGAATVTPSVSAWDVDASVDLHGKGLGRLALRLLGKRLRRSFDEGAAAYWSSIPGTVASGRAFLVQVQQVVDGEGGLATVLHRTFWESGYDQHLATTYGLE